MQRITPLSWLASEPAAVLTLALALDLMPLPWLRSNAALNRLAAEPEAVLALALALDLMPLPWLRSNATLSPLPSGSNATALA